MGGFPEVEIGQEGAVGELVLDLFPDEPSVWTG